MSARDDRMSDWLLRQMPEMLARYEYVKSLLEWLQEWINEIKSEKPKFPWMVPSPLLLSSLERAAQECKDVRLLRFLVDVQKQIAELEKVNRATGNSELAISTLMDLSDNVPKLEKRLKTQLIWSGVMARVFFLVLLFLLVGAGLLAWVRLLKEFFG
jgi:hypothetical protein